MKHPHCNRSRAAHMFWCRGFAPVVFILAIALIVVAIGSGIYFAVTKKTAQAPSPQEAAMLPVPEVAIESTSTVALNGSTSTISTAPAVALATPKVAPVTVVNCGSGTKTAEQCIAEHIKSCSPAKGTFVDPGSGLTVERIIDGYKGNLCSYRTNIVSGSGDLALLAGMQINCMLPKATLATTAQGGSMSQEDLFAYCTGSFMELMREQMGL